MTIITASEAGLATLTAQAPTSEDLDVKYSLFNTVIRNAVAAGLWTQRMTVAVRNASEFKAWANVLGYTVLTDVSNETLAANIDGFANESLARFLVSWRKVKTFALRDLVSIHEGDQLYFDLVLEGYKPGDTVYWTNTGTTNAQDYGIGPEMARPQGSWLTVKTAEAWALENAAMARLLTLLARAQGNTSLVTRYTRQVAKLKQKLEYEAGLKQLEYRAVDSQYEGELTLTLNPTTQDVQTAISLLVFRDKGLEQATGITETDETLKIKIWADPECTQLLYTSATFTVVNEV
jgi:hypothetical protein